MRRALVKLTLGLFHFFSISLSPSLLFSLSLSLSTSLFFSLSLSPWLPLPLYLAHSFFSLSLASFRFHFCPIFLSFMSVLSFTPFPIRSNHSHISIYFHLFIHSILNLSLSPAKFVILSFLYSAHSANRHFFISFLVSLLIHSFFFSFYGIFWFYLLSYLILSYFSLTV